MSRTWARAVTGACSALVVAAATLVIGGAPAASAADGCSAEYTVASDWGSGFVGNVTVTNTSGTPATGWTVQWTLPSGHTITNTWNAELSVNGSTVTATNTSWNGSLPVGGSASFGFQGTGSGASSLPTDIACFLDAPGGGTPGGPNEPGGPDEPGGPGTPGEPVRIMPLGDSITGSPGCWRALLWQRPATPVHQHRLRRHPAARRAAASPTTAKTRATAAILVTNVADQNQLPGWLSATSPTSC